MLVLGEGNDNALQYSCLEDLVDRGASWAAVYGVAQSQTRLKRLSMHACIGEGNGNPLQCMKVKSESEVAQSCPTLIDSMDCSLPGSSIHGIFQARVLEWGAIAFSEQRTRRAEEEVKLPSLLNLCSSIQ